MSGTAADAVSLSDSFAGSISQSSATAKNTFTSRGDGLSVVRTYAFHEPHDIASQRHHGINVYNDCTGGLVA
ncbi:hypothetical protein F441_09307 [Phytophthora nicotianae CJ01A1]|uniref:Uncharacterized protein n=6 Tax=Phytophthora nicotianae TaxID=4792 RepID=W2Q7H9_PHYN3|nr:hypothetical protein PPTG_23028 [Phytophthora nicotianae INRA-310]ETI46236.1 hypothetical protein F443_09350 [Phytophthora nicotianae P1569]ETK86175.1 hypothetical protein L915_09170 [Phytophthora nicotianae]ETO74898.1 hypothetical protein F444_09434 [Phytophthora nicotianae P1976]ETP16039.1 hypothetical protein F441_09307 [Phytophthora nicotianae CJ01A1]ETP44095.1 hypothetical protein F442_09270 [Phytophthora nicotianae P10297]